MVVDMNDDVADATRDVCIEALLAHWGSAGAYVDDATYSEAASAVDVVLSALSAVAHNDESDFYPLLGVIHPAVGYTVDDLPDAAELFRRQGWGSATRPDGSVVIWQQMSLLTPIWPADPGHGNGFVHADPHPGNVPAQPTLDEPTDDVTDDPSGT